MTSQEDIEEIADAIEKCTSTYFDEVGEGSNRIPAGARLTIDVEGASLSTKRKNAARLVL